MNDPMLAENGFIDSYKPEGQSLFSKLFSNPGEPSAFGERLKPLTRHLPSFNGQDYALGGALGGLGGYAYHKLQDGENGKLTEKENRNKALTRILAGAGIGGLGTNVALDRLRRYASNTSPLKGYEAQEAKPRGWDQFITAAIKDKPTQQAVLDGNTVAKARYELTRRGMGIHNEDPNTDMFSRSGDGIVSLNPRHHLITQHLKALMSLDENEDDFNNPAKLIGKVNTDEISKGFMKGVTGGQRMSMYPYFRPGDTGPAYEARTLDSFNVTPRSYERQEFLDWLQGKKTDSKGYMEGQSEGDKAKSFMQRWLADKLLFKKPQWVGQKYDFTPEENGRYSMTPATYDGKPYQQKLKYTPDELYGLPGTSWVPTQ